MKHPFQSLRARLTLALFVGFAALMTGTAWWMASAMEQRVARDFDQHLLTKARDLASLVEQENGVVEFDYVARFQPEFERTETPGYFQIWLANGLELMRSRWLVQDLTDPAGTVMPRFGDTLLGNGRSVRHVTIRFLPHSANDEAPPPVPLAAAAEPPHEIVMTVARDREPLAATLQSLHRAILLATTLAALLGVVLIGVVIRFGLRPVRSLADQVGRLRTDELEARIGAPGAPSELTPIIQQVNDLLGRLQEARLRERRFAGNVAHELRTPVAELRSLASVAKRWPDDKAAVRGFFGDVADVAQRMDGIIGDLLLLARIQGGGERAAFAPVPLGPLVAASVARHGNGPAAASVQWEVAPLAIATSDPGRLAIVLDNLLGNAIAYRRPGTPVVCRGGADGGRFWLEVRNAAEPLSPADLARICEPFWRGDEARSAGEHAGLGLALVTAIAPLLHLEVRFAQDPGGTFIARVEGPAPAAGDTRAEAVSPPTPMLMPNSLQRPA